MSVDPSYIAIAFSVVAIGASIYAARQSKLSAGEAKRANDAADAKRHSDALSLASEEASQILSVASKIGARGADLLKTYKHIYIATRDAPGRSRYKPLVEKTQKTQKTIDDVVLMTLPAKFFLDDFADHSLFSPLADIERATISFNATRILLEGAHDLLAGKLDTARDELSTAVAEWNQISGV